VKVAELFGPTVQGEGPLAGRVTHFLRLGGCDYRCSWCDTMYAVEPELVREMEDLEPAVIAERLAELAPAPALTISGGNPALWKLEQLLELLRRRYRILAAETQGSVWRPWLERLDSLVVSPKPPSSGMATERNFERFETFMRLGRHHPGLVLKVVVFDSDDLTWATEIHRAWPRVPFYLSAGTDVDDEDHGTVVHKIAGRYGVLCSLVTRTPALHDVVVLPQLHVIAWGHRVGV
jgi:7-carboxy-7-deazaguanine synthase